MQLKEGTSNSLNLLTRNFEFNIWHDFVVLTMTRVRQIEAIPKKLLITGCGRSGTGYITFLLRRLGMGVEHDRMGKEGIVTWLLAVDAESVPWGLSPRRQFAFDAIFHQVRYPLDVIRSLSTFKDDSWKFICDHTPCRLDEPLVLRSAKYWYYWNSKAEEIAHWRYRIEDISSVFETMCEQLHVVPNKEILDMLPTDINTRNQRRLFRIYEKFCERCRVNPSSYIRYRLLGNRSNKINEMKVSWDALHALDPAVYEKVRRKAVEYGYLD